MSYNEIALQRAGKHHKSELATKDAEIAALREAHRDAMDMLENIQYWETTPDEYHDRINKLKALEATK